MGSNVADLLRTFTQQMDSALNTPPAEVAISRLKAPWPNPDSGFVSPIMWFGSLSDLKQITEEWEFFDQPLAQAVFGAYLISGPDVSTYIVQNGTAEGATPEFLLWDLAVAIVWKRTQGQISTKMKKDTPPKDTLLSLEELERLGRQFNGLSQAALKHASKQYSDLNRKTNAETYLQVSRMLVPGDATKQKKFAEWLWSRGTETKVVSAAATYIKRHRQDEAALQFLVLCRDTLRRKCHVNP